MVIETVSVGNPKLDQKYEIYSIQYPPCEPDHQQILQLKTRFSPRQNSTLWDRLFQRFSNSINFYGISTQDVSSFPFWNIHTLSLVRQVTWCLYMAEMPFRCGILIATGSRWLQQQKKLPSHLWKNLNLKYLKEKSFFNLISKDWNNWWSNAWFIQSQKSSFKL